MYKAFRYIYGASCILPHDQHVEGNITIQLQTVGDGGAAAAPSPDMLLSDDANLRYYLGYSSAAIAVGVAFPALVNVAKLGFKRGTMARRSATGTGNGIAASGESQLDEEKEGTSLSPLPNPRYHPKDGPWNRWMRRGIMALKATSMIVGVASIYALCQERASVWEGDIKKAMKQHGTKIKAAMVVAIPTAICTVFGFLRNATVRHFYHPELDQLEMAIEDFVLTGQHQPILSPRVMEMIRPNGQLLQGKELLNAIKKAKRLAEDELTIPVVDGIEIKCHRWKYVWEAAWIGVGIGLLSLTLKALNAATTMRVVANSSPSTKTITPSLVITQGGRQLVVLRPQPQH